jgi:hypothetical protein
MSDNFRSEAVSPILNKVGQFISSNIIRQIIGSPHSTVDIEEIMNSGKILILNLPQGKMGEDNAALLGAMFITKIQCFFIFVDYIESFVVKYCID